MTPPQVLRCAVPCCAMMHPAALCCAVLCCAMMHCAASCCAMPYCAAPCCSTARKGGPHCWLHTFCNNESLNLFLVLAVLADDDSEEGVAAVLGTIRPASGGDGEDTSSTDEEVAAAPSGEGGERRAGF